MILDSMPNSSDKSEIMTASPSPATTFLDKPDKHEQL